MALIILVSIFWFCIGMAITVWPGFMIGALLVGISVVIIKHKKYNTHVTLHTQKEKES